MAVQKLIVANTPYLRRLHWEELFFHFKFANVEVASRGALHLRVEILHCGGAHKRIRSRCVEESSVESLTFKTALRHSLTYVDASLLFSSGWDFA